MSAAKLSEICLYVTEVCFKDYISVAQLSWPCGWLQSQQSTLINSSSVNHAKLFYLSDANVIAARRFYVGLNLSRIKYIYRFADSYNYRRRRISAIYRRRRLWQRLANTQYIGWFKK